MGIAGDLVELDLLGEAADDRPGRALLSGAAGAADAVDVVLVFLGDVVVDDTVDVVHVDAAGGDVGGDQDGELSGPEALHRLLALRLGDVAMDAVGVESGADKIVAEALAEILGVAEDHHALIAAEPEQALHGL